MSEGERPVIARALSPDGKTLYISRNPYQHKPTA